MHGFYVGQCQFLGDAEAFRKSVMVIWFSIEKVDNFFQNFYMIKDLQLKMG